MEYEILTRSLKDSAAHSKLKLLKAGETFGVEKPGGEKRIHIGAISDEKKWDNFFFPNGGNEFNVYVSKIDLIKYLLEAKNEYLSPSQSYRMKISDYYDDLCEQTLAIPDESFQICFEKNTDKSRYYLSRPSGNPFSKNYDNIINICLPIVTQYIFLRVKDGKSYTFYLRPVFKPDFATPGVFKAYSIYNKPLQRIFYGAPGTGKSHEIKKCTQGDDTVIRTTFHPDSDYSTFVGCYKPTMSEPKPIYGFDATGKTVRVEDPKGTIFRERKIEYKFVQQAFTKAYIRAWKKLAKPEFHFSKYLTFTIGTDVYTICDVDDVKITITKKTAKPEDGKSSHKEDNDSSAEKGIDVPQNEKENEIISISKDEIHEIFKSDNPNISNPVKEKIKERLKDGDRDDFDGLWENFKEKVRVEKNAYKQQFLIIEEINRGNCAQIFGDLFQLLDRKKGYSEYPIEPDEDLRKELEKEFSGLKLDTGVKNHINSLFKENYRDGITDKILKGELLVLPENLYIWATMNTSDQSLFPMDSAFKRRWEWKYIPIGYKNEDWEIEIGVKKYKWVDFQRKINDKIYSIDNSEDKLLGDFFVDANRTGKIISADTFLNKILFYIWNDVCKDDPDQIFRWKDDKDSDKEKSIRFSDFFCEESERNRKIQGLMSFLKVKAIGESEGITDLETSRTEEEAETSDISVEKIDE